MASEALTRGHEALRRGDWESARAAFSQALDDEETAEALDGLARALWWLADVDGAVRHRARAFTAFRRDGDITTAARTAWWLVREHGTVLQNTAAANGWLARGQQLLDESPPAAAHGWLDLAGALQTTDVARREQHADSAYSAARRADDPDLEIYALAQRGLARISAGDVTAGIADLDAAMAASPDASVPETVGDTICAVMLAVELVGDFERFAQWAQAPEAYLAEYPHVPLYGFCFTCCGEVFAVTGQWEAADSQLLAAIEALEQSSHRSRCAHPVARLAQLRIRQGRLDEADGLLQAYRHLPEAVEPAATLLVARGQHAAAGQVLERRLAQIDQASLPAVPLLALLVQARTGESDPAGATPAARRLAEMAERSGLDRVQGLAALAEARIARCERRTDDALVLLDRAVSSFGAASMPLDAGIARRELAQLAADSRPDVAVAEAKAALDAFEELGARREADQAAAVLRSLGVRSAPGPKNLGQLTQREHEVLELVAAGLTNAEIAERLYISSKTAGNHVSNVLTKLGVRTRTEAAALALRHGSRSA